MPTKTKSKSVAPAQQSRPQLDLVGLTEISSRIGQKRSTVHQWMTRHADFPAPYVELSCGRIWVWEDVDAWLVPVPADAGGVLARVI